MGGPPRRRPGRSSRGAAQAPSGHRESPCLTAERRRVRGVATKSARSFHGRARRPPRGLRRRLRGSRGDEGSRRGLHTHTRTRTHRHTRRRDGVGKGLRSPGGCSAAPRAGARLLHLGVPRSGWVSPAQQPAVQLRASNAQLAPPPSHNAPSAGGPEETGPALSRPLSLRRCAKGAARSARRVRVRPGAWRPGPAHPGTPPPPPPVPAVANVLLPESTRGGGVATAQAPLHPEPRFL